MTEENHQITYKEWRMQGMINQDAAMINPERFGFAPGELDDDNNNY